MAVFRLKEDQTHKYTAVIKDEDGSTIAGSSLVTLTLTLYDNESGDIINSRNAQNVLNANNVTVDASGNLEWEIQPEDAAIVDDTKLDERHTALWTFTYGSGGSKKGRHETIFIVENLAKV